LGDKVLVANDFDTTKNPNLVPNWKGPVKVIDVNDTNTKIKIKNKIKVLIVSKLKHFYENIEKLTEKQDTKGDFNQEQDAYKDVYSQAQSSGPVTRAQAKLIKYKDASELVLQSLKSEEAPTNIDSLCDPDDHCAKCKREYNYFENQNTLHAQWGQLKLAEAICKKWRLRLMEKEAKLIIVQKKDATLLCQMLP
jgi:hypothetical protein